jgi:hypothetical protein
MLSPRRSLNGLWVSVTMTDDAWNQATGIVWFFEKV